MAAKKKATPAKKKIGKAPSLNERITDFSIGGHSKPVVLPKRKR